MGFGNQTSIKDTHWTWPITKHSIPWKVSFTETKSSWLSAKSETKIFNWKFVWLLVAPLIHISDTCVTKPMLTGKISYDRLLHPPILFPVPFWVQNCFCLHPSSTPSSVGRFAPSRPFLQYKLHSKLQQQDFKQPQLSKGLTYWAETNTVELVFPYSFTGYP